jgi:acyl-CoA synthetase (AMP-forming)/AMP-acid ligase II
MVGTLLSVSETIPQMKPTGVNTAWNNAGTALNILFCQGWSRRDLHTAALHAVEMLNNSPRPVLLVIDQQEVSLSSGEFIGSAHTLRHLTEHPLVSHVVVIGVPAETRLLCQSHPAFRLFHFADTRDDGEDLIAQLEYLTRIEALQINVS